MSGPAGAAPRRLLVTGAGGVLGAAVALAAADRGARVVGTVHRSAAAPPEIDVVRADLGDEAAARALVRDARPEWVIHCAAMTDVDGAEDRPGEARRANVEASRALAQAAAAAGAGIVYVSTDAVFSGERGGYREDDATGPVNVYARTKLEGEAAVAAANPRHVVVRTTLYGWNPGDRRGLAEWVLGRLEGGGEVPGFADVRFNPLVANDLARVLLDLAALGRAGTVHAAAADAVNKYEFARMVAEVFGFDPERVRPSSVADVAFRAPRPRDTTLNASRAAEWLGRPMPTVRQGVERFRAARDEGYLDRLRGRPAHADHAG